MKTYLRILSYAKPYKGKIAFYFFATLLSVIFTALTFYMTKPLLELLFNADVSVLSTKQKPTFSWNPEFLREYIEYKAASIGITGGRSAALLFVTLFVVGLNLIGNVFKFFSNYALGTVRTKVVEDIRRSVFGSLLGQQVSYIENERKGDLMNK